MALNLSDNRTLYEGISEHLGHELEVASYAGGENVAIECVTCGSVLLDVDAPEDELNATYPNYYG